MIGSCLSSVEGFIDAECLKVTEFLSSLVWEEHHIKYPTTAEYIEGAQRLLGVYYDNSRVEQTRICIILLIYIPIYIQAAITNLLKGHIHMINIV